MRACSVSLRHPACPLPPRRTPCVHLCLALLPAGLKTYCLQHLASNSSSSPSLHVVCPICRTPYQIVMREKNSRPSSWREFVEWSSTDSQLLLRHVRFLFLVAPLVCSSVVAWTWLVAYWDDLYRNGPGEPLTEAGPQPDQLQGPSAYALRGALLWLPVRAYPLTAVLRWLPYLLAPPPCTCLLYTSPSPRDRQKSRMPSSA